MSENPSLKMRSEAGKSPEEAKFFWTGGPLEVAERTWFASVGSGVTAFETDDGLMLIDSGTKAGAPLLAGKIREETDAPVNTAVFTHGHIDHAYGLSDFLLDDQAAPTVIAHREMPARFERYTTTTRHNRTINARQFGGTDDTDIFEVDGEASAFHTPLIPPDTLYDDELAVHVGGVRFELHHARGETDDHTWVFCPDRGVLCPGDLVIWGVPNAGNPQKVQRYPWDWAAALRAMDACGATSMCPGHGGPIVDDAETIHQLLTETADYLEAIIVQVVDALEAGTPPHVDIVRSVEVPATDSPWLQPVYDEAEFIARNVIRYYGGWYTGRPSELKPAPRADVGAAMAAVAGGTEHLIAHMYRYAETDLRLACHLADFALEAAPDDPHVQDAVADIYERRATEQDSLMATNLYRSAAAFARDGRAFS